MIVARWLKGSIKYGKKEHVIWTLEESQKLLLEALGDRFLQDLKRQFTVN